MCEKPFDTTFRVRGRKYFAHRNVLASSSPYFQAMFSSQFNSNERNVFRLKTFDPRTFLDILAFMYTYECDFSGDVVDLLMMSELMILPNLFVYISVNVEAILNQDNCLDILQYSLYSGYEYISQTVTQLIITNRMLISCAKPHKDWNFDILRMVFTAHTMRYCHKLKLLKYFKYWITVDPLNRVPLLFKVVNSIISENVKPSIREYAEELRNLLLTSEIKYVISNKPNFDLYVIGGHAHNHIVPDPFISHNELLTLHPGKNNTYSKRYSIGRMITQRIHFASASDMNGFYLIGGIDAKGNILASVEYYDYDDKIWTQIPELKKGIVWGAATSMNSRIYVSGGLTRKRHISSASYLFIPKHSLWKPLGRMNQQRRGHRMVNVNGVVYSIGGHDGRTPLNAVEMYNPFHNFWRNVSSLRIARHRFGAVAVGRFIFVFGGLGFSGPIKTVEMYDTFNNQWQVVAEIYPAYDLGVTAWGTDIYVCGGFNGIHDLNNIICFDTVSYVSRLISQLKIARHGLSAFVLPNNKPGNIWGQI